MAFHAVDQLDGRGANFSNINNQHNHTVNQGDRYHNGDIHLHLHPLSLASIRDCLTIDPVSALEYAFSSFQDIFEQYKQVKTSQAQLLVLNESLAKVLKTLNGRYGNLQSLETQTEKSLSDFDKLLDEVADLTETCASENLLPQVFDKENRQAQITSYYQRIESLLDTLLIPAPIDIRDAQTRDGNARTEDQEMLDQKLSNVAKNRRELTRVVNEAIGDSTAPAMMASLENRSKTTTSIAEKRFFTRAHQSLSTSSGEQLKVEDWMITKFDVEFGRKVGSGGFGQVFRGRWKKVDVAIKVLKVEKGAAADTEIVRHEVAIWSTFRHLHILGFYGANVLDDRPFIVMPYLKNGNALDFIQRNPRCDRVKMLCDVSLGLFYLHSKNVVHGDIKAANVLIDDAGRAVLADFGLSRVKADATSRTAKHGGSTLAGSRNWMAPELLVGGSLRKPCDIYAFGMIIFEIHTNEIPLANIPDGDFIDMVTKNHARPQREDVLHILDELWDLAERCWAPLARDRPDVSRVCDVLNQDNTGHLTSTTQIMRTPSLADQTPVPIHHTAPTNTSLEKGSASVPPSSLSPSNSAAITNPLQTRLSIPSHSTTTISQTLSSSSPSANAPPYNRQTYFSSPFVADATIKRSCRVLKGHIQTVTSAAFSSDGTRVVSGSWDNTLLIWDARAGPIVAGPLKGHEDAVYSVALSPDGTRVVSGSKDNTVRVWSVATGFVIAGPFKVHTGEVNCVAFSPDGTRVVSGSDDRILHIWDAETGLITNSLRGHSWLVSSVTFSPDGERVVSGSWDKTLRIWNTRTGSVIYAPLRGHTDLVRSVAFSPNGKQVVSGSDDKTLRIWDTESGSLLAGPFEGHIGSVRSVAFSPDGMRVVSGSGDHTLRIWDIRTGHTVVGPFEGHTDAVYSVAFSPDGKQVASGSIDRTVRIWDV